MDDCIDISNEGSGERLLRVKEAAAKLAVSSRTIWRMIGDGELKVVRVRHCTRLSSTDVLRWQQGGGKVV